MLVYVRTHVRVSQCVCQREAADERSKASKMELKGKFDQTI